MKHREFPQERPEARDRLCRSDSILMPMCDSLEQRHENNDDVENLGHCPQFALANHASQEPIDLFFDDVMVMAEDANIRNNRLTLLRDLRSKFLELADFSLLQ